MHSCPSRSRFPSEAVLYMHFTNAYGIPLRDVFFVSSFKKARTDAKDLFSKDLREAITPVREALMATRV